MKPVGPSVQKLGCALDIGAHLSFCALAGSFSLTPCFSWGLGDVLTRQPFQRLSADGKPLKAVGQLRPPSPNLRIQRINETSWCSIYALAMQDFSRPFGTWSPLRLNPA